MKAKITPKNIFGFVQGWSRKLFGIDMPKHIEEQIQWRLSLLKPECKIECQHCHCTFPEKAFENRGCEHPTDPCYGPMLNEEQWKIMKQVIIRGEEVLKERMENDFPGIKNNPFKVKIKKDDFF